MEERGMVVYISPPERGRFNEVETKEALGKG
jgi:hypothetical protein